MLGNLNSVCTVEAPYEYSVMYAIIMVNSFVSFVYRFHSRFYLVGS